MKHRYIFCGLVHGYDKISDFRLISSCTKYNLGEVIRVNIPDDLDLCHCHWDSYSTTFDERTLDELGYDCYIVYEGKWRKFNILKEYEPHEWWEVLENIYSLYRCGEYGYTTSYDKYKQYWNDGISGKVPFKSENELRWPKFKEDKNELNLEIKLKDRIFHDSDKRYLWYKKYHEIKNTL